MIAVTASQGHKKICKYILIHFVIFLVYRDSCSVMWLLDIVYAFYFSFLHHMYKWVIHRLTGKCELLRIIYSVAPQAAITCRVGELIY